MSLDWDYSSVAEDYSRQPPYAPVAVNTIVELANLGPRSEILDVGAGCGRLTFELARHAMRVIALEPCPAMREKGEARAQVLGNVEWREGTGEETGGADAEFDLVAYGSSFHTVNRSTALTEAARTLKPGGWIACLWNHRDLNDPLQARIEDFLSNAISGFGYGVQREDQSQVLQDSGYFSKVQRLNFPITVTQSIDDLMAYWRSEMVLVRKAGASLPQVLAGLERILRATKKKEIEVPYSTKVWVARLGA